MRPGSPISTADRPSDREVVFRRLLDAPRELVWKVWSDPEHLHHWFGPAGFTLTTLEFAFVRDGVWRFIMHGPDGTDYPNLVVFREIVPPSRLVYENGWDLPGWPLDFVVVVMSSDPRMGVVAASCMSAVRRSVKASADANAGIRNITIAHTILMCC